MAPMVRLVASAKGLAVGVLTLCISLAGTYAYGMWRASACPIQPMMVIGQQPAQHSCNQGLTGRAACSTGWWSCSASCW
jgi:hypothetical protein